MRAEGEEGCGTTVWEDKMKERQRRRQMSTSGRVFVCASFKLSRCHCQDWACMRVCGFIYACFVCTRHVSCVSDLEPSSNPSGVSTSWLLSKYLEEMKRESQGEQKGGKTKQERDRDGLEPPSLLLLASSQRLFCETRGRVNRVRIP